MADSGIRTRHLWLPNRGDTQTYVIIQDTNCSADHSARHGQNQEKEKNSRLLNWKFSKLCFRRKINIKTALPSRQVGEPTVIMNDP